MLGGDLGGAMSNPESSSVLTEREYVHLAEHALRMGQWERAETLAREASVHYPSGEFSYLYGAVCAHQKEFSLAVQWLGDALERGTIFRHAAAFQLGLIHITSADVAAAERAWEHLADLAEDHYFRLFSAGMSALVANQFAEAKSLISQGLMENTELESINDDMSFVLEQLSTLEG